MVDIEERTLRSLEEDTFTLFGQVVQDLRNVRGYRRDALGCLQRILERLREIDLLRPEIVLQQEVVVIENLAQLGRKLLAQEQIRHS